MNFSAKVRVKMTDQNFQCLICYEVQRLHISNLVYYKPPSTRMRFHKRISLHTYRIRPRHCHSHHRFK